jgi:hypothetical protein
MPVPEGPAQDEAEDPAIAATSPALPRATVKLQSGTATSKPAPAPAPMPKATVPLAVPPSATVALPKGALPSSSASATVSSPAIKKVPVAPKHSEATPEETEVDVSDDAPAVTGLDKLLAGVAVVVALLSTLTSFWAYSALG